MRPPAFFAGTREFAVNKQTNVMDLFVSIVWAIRANSGQTIHLNKKLLRSDFEESELNLVYENLFYVFHKPIKKSLEELTAHQRTLLDFFDIEKKYDIPELSLNSSQWNELIQILQSDSDQPPFTGKLERIRKTKTIKILPLLPGHLENGQPKYTTSFKRKKSFLQLADETIPCSSPLGEGVKDIAQGLGPQLVSLKPKHTKLKMTLDDWEQFLRKIIHTPGPTYPFVDFKTSHKGIYRIVTTRYKDITKFNSMTYIDQVKYTVTVLAALEAAHTNDCCHLDIKRDNMKMNDDEEHILIDYGMAVYAGQNIPDNFKCCTPNEVGRRKAQYWHMAPEMWYLSGSPPPKADKSMDIYSVGMLLKHVCAQADQHLLSLFSEMTRESPLDRITLENAQSCCSRLLEENESSLAKWQRLS